jgi:hypothetical protein
MLALLVVAFALPSGVEQALDGALSRHGQLAVEVPSPAAQPGQSSPPNASASPPISVSDRFEGLGSDRSLEIRLRQRWPVFLAIAMRDPIFGAGPSAATEAADGYYIRSFTEVGVVGTLAFGALVMSVLVALRRVARSTVGDWRAAAIGLLAGTLFIALVGVLIDSWVASRVMQLYWPLVGATLAALLSSSVVSAHSDPRSGGVGPAPPRIAAEIRMEPSP